MERNDDLSLLHQLGRRVAYLRKERKKSQLDLALDAGVAKNYISDVENGRRNPSILVLGKIAKGLGITLEELFRGIVELDALLSNR
jgi:transcriptional regulator with XRE-family HTH domain